MFVFLISLLLLFFTTNLCHADTLDGRSSVIYQSSNYTFTSGCAAQGVVILDNGFTITSGYVQIDLSVPLYGTMDLNRTASVVLLNNLVLASDFTLANGGIIQGNGHSLILNDNLVIPEMTTLRIASTLTIEGNGHTIYIDNFAQLLTDTHSTLTLRNVILRNINNTTDRQPLAASGTDSIIALDNVKVEFDNNFYFDTGTLFFHNDVLFSGDFQFMYTSKQKSFITSKSTLEFDNGSTFYYLPRDSSTTPLIMTDDSSRILFNNATFKSNTTGMGLTTGKLIFANNVNLEPGSELLDPLSPLNSRDYGTEIKSVAWSPSGNYLAVGGQGATSGPDFANTNEVRIYKLDLATTSILTPVASIAYGNMVNAVSWSNDEKYLAIAGTNPGTVGGFNNHDEIRIYSFDSTDLIFSSITSTDYGSTQNVNSLEWHPSAYYLAVGGETPTLGSGGFNNQNNIRIYYFNKYTNTLEPFASTQYDELTVNSTVYSMKWRFTGDYIAVGGYRQSNKSNLKVFTFDNTNLSITQRLTLYQQGPVYDPYNPNNGIRGVDWDNKGRFIAVGIEAVPIETCVFIHKFDTTAPTPLSLILSLSTYTPTMGAKCIRWSSDSTKLAFGTESSGNHLYDSSFLWLSNFSYDEDSQTASLYGTSLEAYNEFSYYPDSKLNTISFHPTLNTVAIGGLNPRTFAKKLNSNELQLYKLIPSALNDTFQLSTGGPSFAWHPSGKYAVGGSCPGYTEYGINLYYFNEYSEALSTLGYYRYSNTNAYWGVFTSAWSPVGDYIAIGGNSSSPGGGFNNTDQLRIYKLQQETLLTVTSIRVGPTGTGLVKRVAWHPTGKYLAVGSKGATSGYGFFSNSNNVRIYSFNGSIFSPVASYDFGSDCQTLAWSPEGNYLVVCGRANGPSYLDVSILKFIDYTNLVYVTGDTYNSNMDGSFGCVTACWGIENNIATSGSAFGDGTRIYKFTGTSLNLITSGWYMPSHAYYIDDNNHTGNDKITFTPDGRYLILQELTDGLLVFKNPFPNTFLEPSFCLNKPGRVNACLALRPDGKYLAGSSTWNGPTTIYKINYGANPYDNQLNGLNLGSRMETKVLSSAQVSLSGNLNYNNQN